MNKINIKWVAILVLGVLVASCTVNRYNYKSTPVNMQVNLDYEDLEFIEEVTGTATQSYVMGLAIGGKEKYKQVNIRTFGSSLLDFNLNDRGVNNALYDALSDMDDVDLVVPLTTYVESNRMFLGRSDSIVVRLKAYKIK